MKDQEVQVRTTSLEAQETATSRRSELKAKIRRLFLNFWIWELLSLCLSVTAMASIASVLLVYDDGPLPLWRYGLTLNGIISFLAGIAKASMILPVAQAIGQLKWRHYWHRQNPVIDFQRFDRATRGPLGCLQLLLQPARGNVALMGALITVAALVLEPSVQLILTYPSRMVAIGTATLPRLQYYRDVQERELGGSIRESRFACQTD